MDATAYLALSAALDRELPSALESMAEARERAAMAFEDLAAHAITGRVVHNPQQRHKLAAALEPVAPDRQAPYAPGHSGGVLGRARL